MQKRVMFIAILLLAICNKIVAEDQITISDFNLYPGDTKEVSVVLTNEESYVGFQFDLYLPTGVTVESFSASSRIPEGTTPQMAQQTDGSYRFVAAALGGNPIAGNGGSVLTLTVKAGDSIAANDYTGYLRNVKISKADGSGTVIAEQAFTVTVNATVWSVIGTINGNWDTDSEMTSTDGVNYTVTIPYLNADTYEFKIRANGDWTENYGLNGVPDGQNIPVTVPEDNTGVVITFNKDTKVISYSLVLPVYTVSGDFNGWSDSEAMTKDANGIYFVTIDAIDAGGHEFKIRTNNSWDVNYGLNGLRDGDNIPFTVAGNSSVTFYFDPSTKIASTVYPLAPEPYAVVTEVTATENTVTLYYDNLRNSHERTADIGDFMGDWANLSSTVTTVTFDPSFAAYRPTSTAWWFSGFSNMTAINGIENLCTDDVTDMNAMFMSCTSLPSIDLSHFNTGQVVDMSSLFNECTSLTELDLSSFNTANVSNMEWMFYQCSSLKTIYIGEHWSIANVSSSQEMFNGCTVLTGGNGTTFNENNVTAAYAHLDGGTANPGYFTPKGGYGMAAKPTFTHEGNLVFVNSATEGAIIRYTIDDVAPTDTTGIVYSDSISVTRNCTIRAIATRENFIPSEVAEYEVNWFKCEMPTIISWSGDTLRAVSATEDAIVNCILRFTSDGPVAQWSGGPDPQLTLPIENDLFVELFATKEGWMTSDTLKFYYPYTAWHQLTDAINDANTVLAVAANNDNVTDADRNALSSLIEAAQQSYAARTETESAVKARTDELVAQTAIVRQLVEAVNEPYAVLSENNTVLTFYYDKKKEERGGMDVVPFNDINQRGWHEQRENITRVVFDDSFADCDTLTSTASWFAECGNLTTIENLNLLKTANVENMSSMFWNCSSLTSLDLSNFNTANVTNMHDMFWGCSSLTSLDLSNFNTSNVTIMDGLFEYCSGLSSVGVSNFNTTNVTNMMFMFDGCSSLTSLDVSNFNTANVTEMTSMFADCHSLTILDLSNFNTANVTSMWSMFWGNSSLETIFVGDGWSMEKVENSTTMFNGCTALRGGAGTTYSEEHIDGTYAHIDGGVSNPGYFTDKNAPVIEYTFDGTTGVLTINNETTLADALDAAGGRDEVAKTITAIVWNSSVPLTNSDLQGLDNPNMLVYVQSASQAPANRDNVVIGNDSTGYTAKNIKLTDVVDGNGNFYCPREFKAEMISYTHEYRQTTEPGVARGWETIAMPFTVQTIMHETKGLITPFGTDSINKHFWLRQLTQQGLAQARRIEANTPYLISMPNSDAYSAGFNLNGLVTFSSQNVEVPVTQLNVVEAQTGAGDMVMLQPNFKGQSATAMIYALNVGVERDGHPEGSVFEANYRSVRPFEAFTVHHGNGPAPQFISISEMNGDVTGIEDVRCKMSDGRGDNWYDLNGRRLQQKPTKKGIYILNGIKVVIK